MVLSVRVLGFVLFDCLGNSNGDNLRLFDILVLVGILHHVIFVMNVVHAVRQTADSIMT